MNAKKIIIISVAGVALIGLGYYAYTKLKPQSETKKTVKNSVKMNVNTPNAAINAETQVKRANATT